VKDFIFEISFLQVNIHFLDKKNKKCDKEKIENSYPDIVYDYNMSL